MESGGGKTHKLYFYDEIKAQGDFNWMTWDYDESETSAKFVKKMLDSIPAGDVVEVHINSLGGEVGEGVTIYNLLRQKSMEGCLIRGHVDGYAYSAAMTIAMACDEIHMGLGTSMLIHHPWGMAAGNAVQLRGYADQLEALGEASLQLYFARSRDIGEDDLRGMMDAETVMDPETCLKLGFCDVVDRYEKNASLGASPYGEDKDDDEDGNGVDEDDEDDVEADGREDEGDVDTDDETGDDGEDEDDEDRERTDNGRGNDGDDGEDEDEDEDEDDDRKNRQFFTVGGIRMWMPGRKVAGNARNGAVSGGNGDGKGQNGGKDGRKGGEIAENGKIISRKGDIKADIERRMRNYRDETAGNLQKPTGNGLRAVAKAGKSAKSSNAWRYGDWAGYTQAEQDFGMTDRQKKSKVADTGTQKAASGGTVVCETLMSALGLMGEI